MPNWVYLAGFILVGAVVVWVLAQRGLRRLRRTLWMRQFEDADMVDTTMEGRIARGMTLDMVRAVWGDPADLDETVLKTKTKHEMKYDQKGKTVLAQGFIWRMASLLVGKQSNCSGSVCCCKTLRKVTVP